MGERGTEQFYPIVYGNVSYPIAKRSEKISNWIVYVRGESLEDLGFLIEKVVFFLHPSFEERVREVHSHPFQVKESGWGSFEVLIQIWLRSGQRIELKHALKLYHLHSSSNQSKRPLVSQTYDEIVYVNPVPRAMEILGRAPPPSALPEEEPEEVEEAELRSYLQFTRHLTRFQPKEEEQRLRECIRYIRYEIGQIQERIQNVDADIQRGYQDK